MQICHNSEKVRFSLGFYACLVVSILTVPAGWVLAWLFAAIIHEMGHYAAIMLCGGRVFGLRIGFAGAQLEVELPGNKAELISALAGPLCGAILILFGRWFPKLAVCAFVQTMYNLLPVCGFDGERALKCILQCYFSPKSAYQVLNVIEWLVLVSAVLLSVIIAILFKWGIVPIVSAVILTCKVAFRKIPCKQGKQIVQ